MSVELAGSRSSVDYEPAESTHRHVRRQLQLARARCGCRSTTCWCATSSATRTRLGADGPTFEYPTGSGDSSRSATCADDLRQRLISLFLRGPDGRRPCHGWVDTLQNDPRWRDNITFNEYFHGDNGAGLGATHQTGWTGIVADLICRPDPFAGTRSRGSDDVEPQVAFGREVCGSLEEGASREWLVTDGLGGYACGTVAGLRTRRYHGLLMQATGPAGGSRRLGLVALDVVVVIGDRRVRLATHEWAGGAVDPRGHEHLASFDLDDGVPRWRYDLGAVQLEVELAMAHGVNAVGVVHRLLAGEATIEVTPLCTWRDQHGDRFAGPDPTVESSSAGFVFECAYRVEGPGYQPGGAWYRGVYHREEAARGLGPTEDLWSAGTFRASLTSGEALEVVATTDLEAEPPAADSIVARARARSTTLARAPAPRTTSTGSWPWPQTASSSRPPTVPPRSPATRGSASGLVTSSPPTRASSCAPDGPTRDARSCSERPPASPRGCSPTPPTSGRWSTTPSTRRCGSCTPWVATSPTPAISTSSVSWHRQSRTSCPHTRMAPASASASTPRPACFAVAPTAGR